MKKQLSKAKELKGEFNDEKSRNEGKLNSSKKALRQGVAFDARINGDLPEVEVKSLSDGKEQVQKAKQERSKEKKKNKVLKVGLYSTLIGLLAMGSVYLGFKKPNAEPNVNNNGINSSVVTPTNDTKDSMQNDTQNSTDAPDGSTSNSNGSGNSNARNNRNTKPNSNDVISDKSDVKDSMGDNNYNITGNKSTTITIEEDNGNTQQKIDEAKQKGDEVVEMGEGITAIIDKQPNKNEVNNNNTVPTTPSTPSTPTKPTTPDTNTTAPTNSETTAPSTIDTTNTIDVPSAESGLGENETSTYVQTNEPTKEAEDDILDQFLER